MKNWIHGAAHSLIALAVMACGAAANAEKADRKAEVVVNATEGEADHAKGLYKLDKNVVIAQGTLKITGDKGTAKADAKNQYIANIVGKPVCFKQRGDDGEWAQGVADRADYDSSKGVVKLFGNAVLFVGDNEHRANYIIYNTQASTFESRDSKDRKAASKGITFKLQPKDDDEPVTAAAGDKPAAKKPIVKQPNAPKIHDPAFSRCA